MAERKTIDITKLRRVKVRRVNLLTELSKPQPEKPQPKRFKEACRVCSGDIIEKLVYKYNPKTGPPLYGPGSLQQSHCVAEGFYCLNCGLKYEFVPEKKEKK